MAIGYFSKRYNLKAKSQAFACGYVPESARTGLIQILENYFENYSINTKQLYFNIIHALQFPQENKYGKVINFPKDAGKAVGNLLMECEWWQFYDICEVIPRSFAPYYEHLAQNFYEKLNDLFKAEKIGFRITDDGKVEQSDSSFIDATINKARYLLQGLEFAEANEYFEKAIKAIYLQLNPDSDQGVRDALIALELVARKINNSGSDSSLFHIINDMNKRQAMPKPLEQIIRNMDAFTTERQGLDEAELVLAISAALMTYLANKGSQSARVQGLNVCTSSQSNSKPTISETLTRLGTITGRFTR